jgi:hypothetical protein
VKTKTEEKYVKIITVDDWGARGYYLKAAKSAAGTWSHRELDQSMRLKNGDRLEVLWPDGAITRTKARVIEVTETVHDHGHEYPTKSESLFLSLRVNGAKLDFDDFSKIRVRRLR